MAPVGHLLTELLYAHCNVKALSTLDKQMDRQMVGENANHQCRQQLAGGMVLDFSQLFACLVALVARLYLDSSTVHLSTVFSVTVLVLHLHTRPDISTSRCPQQCCHMVNTTHSIQRVQEPWIWTLN